MKSKLNESYHKKRCQLCRCWIDGGETCIEMPIHFPGDGTKPIFFHVECFFEESSNIGVAYERVALSCAHERNVSNNKCLKCGERL